jgi:hypothetical protein
VEEDNMKEASLSMTKEIDFLSIYTWLICGDLNKERIKKAYGNKSPH